MDNTIIINRQIALLNSARQALMEVHSLEQTQEIRAKAKALHEYFNAIKGKHDAAQEAQFCAAEVMVRADRRMGELLIEMRENGERQGRGGDGSNQHEQMSQDVTFASPTLVQLGIDRMYASRTMQLAEMPEDQFEEYIEGQRRNDHELTLNGMLRYAHGIEQKAPAWWSSSNSDDWWTPSDLFDLLDAEFHFELDVCASKENAKCRRYFTRAQNGLIQEWRGKCWMNPPYGREIYQWIQKAYGAAQDGALVVCLVPARTDTNWWWEFCIAGEIRFIRGRIKFANTRSGAPFPSAVIIFYPYLRPTPKVVWWEAYLNGRFEE